MAAILMTSLLGPDAELRWANCFKLLHITQVYFGIGRQKSSQNLHGMPIRHRLMVAISDEEIDLLSGYTELGPSTSVFKINSL